MSVLLLFLHPHAANCDTLPNPPNGTVRHINGTLEGAVAMYTCDPGLVLVGEYFRVCGNNTEWLGSEPTCLGIPVVLYM